MTQRIQCQYDDLTQIVQIFSTYADGTQRLIQTLQHHTERLQRGAWRGRGAEAFYAELDQWVMPALKRLQTAMVEAKTSTQTTMATLREAEIEAGALFRGADEPFTVNSKGDLSGFPKFVSSVGGAGGEYVLASYKLPAAQGSPEQDGDEDDPRSAAERSARYAR